ncbi:hypothetical protein P8452_49925 [Trifolium repens]|nr:hypothetical protein P8452_49925 [Trifolium repens]
MLWWPGCKSWGGGVQDVVAGSYIFVCALGSHDVRCGVCGPVLIDKLNEEIQPRGLKDHISVMACSQMEKLYGSLTEAKWGHLLLYLVRNVLLYWGCDGKISLRCDCATWRAYVSGFMSLMVSCTPPWIEELDVGMLKEKEISKSWNMMNRDRRFEQVALTTTIFSMLLTIFVATMTYFEAESQKPKHRNPLFFFFISRRPSLFFFISRPFCSPPPPKIMSESGSVAQPSQPSLPTQNEELEAQLQSSRQKTDPAWDYCIYKIGEFGKQLALDSIKHMRPDMWWNTFGHEVPNVKKWAIKILSQTASSSGCERNWSVFERIHTKKRNRLEHQRLNDLVFVHYNLRLKNRVFNKNGTYDPIDYERIDDIEFWIMEEDTNSTPILDANEIESMLYNEESIPIIGRLENDEGELAPTIGLEDGRLNLDSFPQEDVNSYSGDDGFHQFAD